MKATVLLLLIISVSFAGENEIKKKVLYCLNLPIGFIHNIKDVDSIVNSDVKYKFTENEIRVTLIEIAKEEYEKFNNDSTGMVHDKLFLAVNILKSCNKNSKIDSLFKKIYNSTGKMVLKEDLAEYIVLKSDKWFEYTKNLVDSINNNMIDNANYNLRYLTYVYLEDKVNESRDDKNVMDSIKCLIYYALEREHWTHVIKLDTLYAGIEPAYENSEQRRDILSKIDNDEILERIKNEQNQLNSNTHLKNNSKWEIAYNLYVKLKKAKKLKEYYPPILKQ